ncbi:hypothetical protein AX16_007474 [Volvariella volvacea WC 439]|nr:hypothetical protein AX16_007474 [Volvariella volvacea WC 439]
MLSLEKNTDRMFSSHPALQGGAAPTSLFIVRTNTLQKERIKGGSSPVIRAMKGKYHLHKKKPTFERQERELTNNVRGFFRDHCSPIAEVIPIRDPPCIKGWSRAGSTAGGVLAFSPLKGFANLGFKLFSGSPGPAWFPEQLVKRDVRDPQDFGKAQGEGCLVGSAVCSTGS